MDFSDSSDSETEYHLPDDFSDENEDHEYDDNFSEYTVNSSSSESTIEEDFDSEQSSDNSEAETDADDFEVQEMEEPADENNAGHWDQYHGIIPENSTTQNVPRDLTCPVCMDLVWGRHPMSTLCGHVFCHFCIKQSFAQNQKCPMCQKNLRVQDIHTLYI
jgi:rubredoxin